MVDLLGLADDNARFVVAERMRLGVATAPFTDPALAQAKGQMLSFVTDGWLRIDHFGWVGLRIPVVAASVALPAGSFVDEAAWGNPELRVAVPTVLFARERLLVRWTFGGGAGVRSRSMPPPSFLTVPSRSRMASKASRSPSSSSQSICRSRPSRRSSCRARGSACSVS